MLDTSELVLELAITAYNILRMIGQESIGRRGDRDQAQGKAPSSTDCNWEYDHDGGPRDRTCPPADHRAGPEQHMALCIPRDLYCVCGFLCINKSSCRERAVYRSRAPKL